MLKNDQNIKKGHQKSNLVAFFDVLTTKWASNLIFGDSHSVANLAIVKVWDGAFTMVFVTDKVIKRCHKIFTS